MTSKSRIEIPHGAKTIAKTVLAICLFVFGNVGADEKPLIVYAVNYPLQYFTERIVDQHGTVVFPAPADVDPAFWVPAPDVINRYQIADVIILNGAGYADWVRTATLSPLRLVDTSKGFAGEFIEASGATKHTHGPDGDHSHRRTAFTTWLDLSQAVQQAAAIRDALVRIRPELRQDFERNYELLEKDLLTLDRALIDLGRQMKVPVIASHPIYQYFSRRYQFDIESVLWEPGQTPTEDQWQSFGGILSSHPATSMIWEGQPTAESRERLNALGVRVVVFDPVFNTSDRGDFLEVMQENIQNLQRVLE